MGSVINKIETLTQIQGFPTILDREVHEILGNRFNPRAREGGAGQEDVSKKILTFYSNRLFGDQDYIWLAFQAGVETV